MSRNWMALAIAGVMTAAAGCGGAGGSKPASSDRKQGLPESTFKVVVRGENAYWDPSTSSTVILPRGGVVTSDVGGLSCGVDGAGGLHKVCSIDAAYATTVVLTATASTTGWVHGWAGACGGTADTCPVFIGSDRLAVIRFAATTTGLGAHANFTDPAVHVVEYMKYGQPNSYRCGDCHGATLQGMGIAPSCSQCHPSPGYPPGFVHPVDGTFGSPAAHGPGWVSSSTTCQACHGATLAGSSFTPGCNKCHPMPHGPGAMAAPAHTAPAIAAAGTTACTACHAAGNPGQLAPSCTSCHTMTHAATYTTHGLDYVANGTQCRYCHSTPQSASGTLNGGLTAPSCAAANCHSAAGAMPHAFSYADPALHGAAYVANPLGCKGCHGQTLSGATPPLQAPSCSKCHATPHDVGAMAPPAHTAPAIAAGGTTACTACHAAGNPGQLAPSCMSCHQLTHPLDWSTSSSHGWQYAAGQAAGAIACVACHGGPALTGGVPPMTAPSCSSCHAWPVGSGKHFLATELAWGNNGPSGWAQACQRCHVSDGFRDYIGGFWTAASTPPGPEADMGVLGDQNYLTGSLLSSNTIIAGTGLPGSYATGTLKCQACHNPQSEPTRSSIAAPSYDGDAYGLVGIQFPSMNQAYSDKVTDLCGQCHQGRSSTPGLNAYINGASATANQGLTSVTVTATGGTTSTLNVTGLVPSALKGFTAVFAGNPTPDLNGYPCSVSDNTATVITLGCVLPVTPGAETVTLYPTATSGTTTTLSDSNRAWTAGQWVGRYVYFYRTVGSSILPTYAKITANTATQLTFGATPPAPTAGMLYQIIPNEAAAALDAQLVGATYQSPHELGAAATFIGADAAGYYQYPVTYDPTPKTSPYKNQASHSPYICTDCHDAHALAIPSTFDCSAQSCHNIHAGTSDQTMAGLKLKTGRWYLGGTDQGAYQNYVQMKGYLYTAIQQYALAKGNVGAGTNVICFNESDPSHLDFFVGTAVGQNDGTCPSSTPWGQAGSNTAYTPRLLRAVYNYKFLVQDPGAWAHNPKYVTDIMYDAIRDLNMGIPVANQINMTGWTRP
jgi:hypothetical protein